jgi:hypothetical protein
MDGSRLIHLEALRRLGADGRVRLGMAMSDLVRRSWMDRLARQHPQASPEEMRAIRVAEMKRFSPSLVS